MLLALADTLGQNMRTRVLQKWLFVFNKSRLDSLFFALPFKNESMPNFGEPTEHPAKVCPLGHVVYEKVGQLKRKPFKTTAAMWNQLDIKLL